MKYLLDTHALLWYLNDDPELPALPRTCIENPTNDISVSIASFWEITIKHALGKLELRTTLEDMYAATESQGIAVLPITIRHLARLRTLPFHHRDPFDRLLIAQAMEEGADLVSGDRIFAAYSVRRVWTVRT